MLSTRFGLRRVRAEAQMTAVAEISTRRPAFQSAEKPTRGESSRQRGLAGLGLTVATAEIELREDLFGVVDDVPRHRRHVGLFGAGGGERGVQVPERSCRLCAMCGADNVSGGVQVSLARDLDELGAGRTRPGDG